MRVNNPLRARTVYYGLPGAYEEWFFAETVHKIKTEFTVGVDVGHVSSAMTAGLWALEPMHI